MVKERAPSSVGCLCTWRFLRLHRPHPDPGDVYRSPVGLALTLLAPKFFLLFDNPKSASFSATLLNARDVIRHPQEVGTNPPSLHTHKYWWGRPLGLDSDRSRDPRQLSWLDLWPRGAKFAFLREHLTYIINALDFAQYYGNIICLECGPSLIALTNTDK